jgi:type VI secretion system protein ImpL
MRTRLSAWISAAGVLAAFSLLAGLLPGVAGASGARGWVLRGVLLLLGLLAAVMLYVLIARRARAAQAAAPPEGSDDLQLAFATAQSRLASSPATAGARVDRLPLALILGPPGSTKTTVMSESGLEPELLAGEVRRGETVAPTDLVNLWYARGTVFLEFGGRLLEDPTAWRRVVQQARPSRLAAALGRGSQAPRCAIVCVACDELVKPGGAEALTTIARQLRARLSEASQELGVRLPVYVLFTRADRLPYFTEYVRSLTTEEAQQVLGATLPLDPETGASWAEAQAARIQPAYDRLVHSLSLARLDILSREGAEQTRSAAYEFPRELRKVRELVVQFLVDMCRPSQLGINPVLRGFYFTGVRPVVVRDVARRAPDGPPAGAGVVAGATSVFDPRMLQQSAQPAARPEGGRRVPQWVFLRRLFPEVVLADDVGRRMTAGGTRVELLRRSLIAGAMAACLVIALGATISFAGNRRLIHRSIAAAEQVREVGGTPGVVGEDDLARLDALRVQAQQLRSYQQDGRPLRLAWGLYRGDAVQPLLRRLYFQRFGSALWDDTRGRLADYLHSLPSEPDEDSDFTRTQDALAAHLVTTTEYSRATPELLTRALLSHARPMGTDSAALLADRQFAFFAGELPFGNPFDDLHADPELVERTQHFLRAFGREAYYRALLYEGSTAAPAARYIGAAAVVRNEVVVPGAFTLAGWRHVQTNLDNVDEVFLRYQWIYGSQPPPDKPRREDLAQMYVAEYIRRWQAYLAGGAVQRFSSTADAAAKLGILAAPTSPLFNMLAVASRETAMDSTSQVARAFQPLHVTVPPDADARGITASALGYANALNALASHMNLLGSAAGPARDQGLLQASAAAADVKREAATLAAAFAMSGEAAVTADQVQRLLRQPAEMAESLVGSLPAADLNAAGRAFCSAFQSVSRRFPFNPGATADAAVDDVHAMFDRDSGVLWSFFDDALQARLTPQGRPRPGARVRADFAGFFARAAEVTGSMFRGPDMMLVFDFQPAIPAGATEVILQVDGEQRSFTPTARASRAFVWEADRARQARLVVEMDGERITVASAEGPWAIFRVFYAGSWSRQAPYRVEWRVPGRATTLEAQVSFESGIAPLLQPGYLSALSQCVSQIID